ncbi:MAG: hypothetical protein E5W56_12335, partial [Mesorhizobium sp.]
MRRSQVTTVSLLAALALAACTNAKDVLDPSAVKPPADSAQALPATPGTSATTSPTTTSPAPAATAAASASATPAQTAALAKT